MSDKYHKVPPRLPAWFLKWACKNDLYEQISGDLEEEFNATVKKRGLFVARLSYLMQVVSFIRPFAIKTPKIAMLNFALISSYITVSLRSLKKEPLNFFISVVGLFIALTCTLSIWTVVRYETSYDTFHEKAERIYRMTIDISREDYVLKRSEVGPPLGPVIKERYNEIEHAVRFRRSHPVSVTTESGKTAFYENEIYYTDPIVFEVFTYPFLYGNPDYALEGLNSAVITEKTARKYFGNQNPVGKTLVIGSDPYEVTGVIAKLPDNMTMKFGFLLPFKAFEVPYGYPVTLEEWRWTSFPTFILLKEGASIAELQDKLPEFAASHFNLENEPRRFQYNLQPLTDIYYGEYKHEEIASGNYSQVITLGAIGILLLFIAAFNFTNIATAKALSRSMETGIRKTFGSSTTALRLRYLIESLLISLIAVIPAILITPFIIDKISWLFNLNINWSPRYLIEIVVIGISVSLVTGLVAGCYPAFLTSGFKPIHALKGKIPVSSGRKIALRPVLVTLQFAITSLLLITSFVISTQVDFLKNKDLGFTRNDLLLIRLPGAELQENYRQIINEFRENATVNAVAVGGSRLDGNTGNVPVWIEGMEDGINMNIDAVKEGFFKTINAQIVEGREFSFEIPADTLDGIIINEAAASYFGWSPEEAIGQQMEVGAIMQGKVMGVVKNYHYSSLHQEIKPLVVYYPRTYLSDIYVKLNDNQPMQAVLGSIESSFKNVLPDAPFDYVFLDDHLNKLYLNEDKFANLVQVTSVLTIFISLMGLYGLMILILRSGMRSMSIRKVLGATTTNLVLHSTRSFLLMIVIANVIAWPLAYLFSNQWLSEFAFKIDMKIEFFFISLMVILVTAGVTILWKTLEAAGKNPVEFLKGE